MERAQGPAASHSMRCKQVPASKETSDKHRRTPCQREIRQRAAKLNKINENQSIKIEEYYDKLDSLEKEYQNALKHMDEYADLFARIDESEVDTLAQRGIELFNKGELEESLRLFEKGNYMSKLKEALRVKAQAQDMRQLADSA